MVIEDMMLILKIIIHSMKKNKRKQRNEPIDIIVITFNRIIYIKKFLEMLHLATDYPFRLIVVDNGSTDGTREWLRRMRRAGLVYKNVFNKENKKMAAAFTEGFKHVESEYFITTQDDIIPPYGKKLCWLTCLLYTIRNNPEFASINFYGPRQNYGSFMKKRWPVYVKKIEDDGGERYERFKKLNEQIYG